MAALFGDKATARVRSSGRQIPAAPGLSARCDRRAGRRSAARLPSSVRQGSGQTFLSRDKLWRQWQELPRVGGIEPVKRLSERRQETQVGEVAEFRDRRPPARCREGTLPIRLAGLPNAAGSGTVQFVAVEGHALEVGKVAELGRESGTVQFVAVEGQELEVGKVAELGGIAPVRRPLFLAEVAVCEARSGYQVRAESGLQVCSRTDAVQRLSPRRPHGLHAKSPSWERNRAGARLLLLVQSRPTGRVHTKSRGFAVREGGTLLAGALVQRYSGQSSLGTPGRPEGTTRCRRSPIRAA